MTETLPPGLSPELLARFRASGINDAIRAEMGWEKPPHWLDDPANSQLKTALETASKAQALIEPEQTRLRELLTESKTDTEREAREYQIWYIEKYYNRAATIAEKRLAYFKEIRTKAQIDAENEKIKSDIVHWFEHYAFGYDPRARTALSIIPFELFPKQAEMVHWLDERVFYKRDSGIIEKSRDEGATELMVRWGLFNWLNRPGFSMLLSTRKEDEVDSKKNQNTLFERIRYQIRLLPTWQYPEGFDVERGMLSTMKLANPENGNTLLGEAPVENMGRGGRVTCAMLDEFAFWSFAGYPQFRSLSQTTDSILMPSSVAGRLNQYADTASDGVTAKFVLDWRENPFKDKRWYNALPFGYISPKMSRTTIAQEVDRNYEASQPGKVWHCREEFVFITQSEFLKPFIAAKLDYKFFDEFGKFRIPADWRVTRTHDYGQSPGHEWSYLLGAQPRANYPLADTHFIFVARNLEPTGINTKDAVDIWRGWEADYGLRDKTGWINAPTGSWNSHEQKELRRVLREKHGESWNAWETDYTKGLTTIEDWWTVVDDHEPNPFRPELNGRCLGIFVAPDDEYELSYNPQQASHFVTVSDSEKGFFTARKQFSAYHFPQSELGKAVKDMRPVKEFDDIVDAWRGYAVNWNRTPERMTDIEVLERDLHTKGLDYEQIEQITDASDQMARRQTRLREEMAFHEKRNEKKNMPRFMRMGRR